MARMLPDPTFYPSPRLASEAPAETLAYVALLTNGQNGKKDALGVVDTDPASPEYGRLVGQARLSRTAATSCTTSAGTPAARISARYAPNPHVERRYLVVPGTHSSRIHVVDTAARSAQPATREGDRG